MKPKYTAKVYFDDGSFIENHADDVGQLIGWMRRQGQDRFCEINGIIVNNKTHRIVKSIQYNPAEDI
ncbi:hypothetical protein [Aquicella lusitana]|uniref:Uncharacterized protein n=1 Tax=Aquicella lusitana TaxID=254246 RepID=A0A370GNC3_9COXI|nr:hypothetical protein [Aquicella lusitana]RDI43423.1 hypothetical protein C8D86_11179 [Aquicella lusitana]VVC73573.1 hypothetical protein AQULUS_13160 [Aquicella lusitana]